MAKKPKLGSGGRFAALKQKIEKEDKSANAATHIAAAIGVKKFGAKKMGSMAAASRKRNARGR